MQRRRRVDAGTSEFFDQRRQIAARWLQAVNCDIQEEINVKPGGAFVLQRSLSLQLIHESRGDRFDSPVYVLWVR